MNIIQFLTLHLGRDIVGIISFFLIDRDVVSECLVEFHNRMPHKWRDEDPVYHCFYALDGESQLDYDYDDRYVYKSYISGNLICDQIDSKIAYQKELREKRVKRDVAGGCPFAIFWSRYCWSHHVIYTV